MFGFSADDEMALGWTFSVPASHAVQRVRSNYCPDAVETPDQCAFVADCSHDTP
jgi:hypothetical protein